MPEYEIAVVVKSRSFLAAPEVVVPDTVVSGVVVQEGYTIPERRTVIEEGDIAVCRKPRGGIGLKEGARYMWAKVIISDELAKALEEPLYEDYTVPEEERVVKKQRRYKLSTTKLSNMDPNFDVVQFRDTSTEYQPYLAVDSKYLFVDPDPTTFELENLSILWDKKEQRFV